MATPLDLGAAADTWIQFDVTTLVADQVGKGLPLMFYMAWNGSGGNRLPKLSVSILSGLAPVILTLPLRSLVSESSYTAAWTVSGRGVGRGTD